MEAPEPLVVARLPSVNVPVCVVSRCVFTSVAKCVLKSTHSVGERLCVRKTTCVREEVGVDETPGVSETPCVGEIASVREKVCVTETPCVKETSCMDETPRVKEAACVSEARCVRGTACVRSLYVREMMVGMREHAAASPSGSVLEWYVSVVTRRSAWVEWRRRRQHLKDKGRVAAVAISGTAPGLHGSEREVRAVLRTRPPRARLRE